MSSWFWAGVVIGLLLGSLLLRLYQRWEYNRHFPHATMKDLKRMADCYGLRVLPGESRTSLYNRLRAHLKMGPRA